MVDKPLWQARYPQAKEKTVYANLQKRLYEAEHWKEKADVAWMLYDFCLAKRPREADKWLKISFRYNNEYKT